MPLRKEARLSNGNAAVGLFERTTETNHVSVGVGDGAFSFSIVLVLGSFHVDPHLRPVLSHAVGVLTVDVEKTVSRHFFSHSLGEMDRQVPIAVCEGIAAIVERHFEACALEPGNRASQVGDLENRLKPGDQPSPRHELQLPIPLSIQPGEAVVADRKIGVRAKSYPPVDRVRAARACHSHR